MEETIAQMMTCLLAEIRTTQGNMDAKMDANQAQMLAWINTMLDAHHKRMTAKMDAWMKGMEACVGKSEANPGKSDTIAENWEVS
jgi:hypothetical protein